MSVDTIFLTPEEVMDRWGMIDPYDFITKIGFEFSPTGEPRIDRHRFKTGNLLAYERSSKAPAVWGESEGGEDRDFSKFVDCEDGLQPHCLQYLTFSFDDVEECEKQKPELIRYAEWARTYRQKTGQKAKQVIDELYRENKEISAPITGKNDDDNETIYSEHALDKSGRKGLKQKQIALARCRVIAELIMEQLPNLRIAQLINSRYITELACKVGNESDNRNEPKKKERLLEEEALRGCVKNLCNPGAKGTLSAVERNQEIVIQVSLVDRST